MKKLMLLAVFVAGTFAFNAMAETGVVFVRTDTEQALEPTLLDTAEAINAGEYPRHKYHDDCDTFARRRVYSVEVGGKRYRSDRHGNLTPYWLGFVKYSCRGGGR